MSFYHTFRYHPTEAPTGRKFTDEAAFNALGPEWVDTPAKFAAAPSSAVDALIGPQAGEVNIVPSRGRKAKAVIQ